jgi:hypothetical protein
MTTAAPLERSIDIFVRDRNGYPISGAEIRFTVNGVPAGEVKNAEGRGRIELADPTARVAVSAIYLGVVQTEQLSQQQNSFTFRFDVAAGSALGDLMERHLALIVGLALIAVAIVLAFVFGTPTPLQTRIILGTFSLAGGAIATEISGMVKVDLTLGTRLTIGATGALAVFIILYLIVPA